MKIIKLNAIDSTNSYLINLAKNEVLEDQTIVLANKQISGRGQQGAAWQSIPQQSLTFSIFNRFYGLSVSDISSIAFATSLGVQKALKKLLIPKVQIKWPNDIMSQSKKVAGILIENQVKQGKIVSSVIGIGLNVNEEHFNNLPQATSMRLTTGVKYNLDEVLHEVSEAVFSELKSLGTNSFSELKMSYEANLFRKETISVFETPNKTRFNGKIKGVTNTGELIIENEEEVLNTYQLKKIKLLF
ncbi:MAG: biotin--[acetyl-CoA-carboxylase] ligase [Flavobacteriaceae bacterium]|nr:biotin--[acetyl-CoA-carboxylase] ligase [Flavobacteriaceae bacterium]